jgi:hypothetical protein
LVSNVGTCGRISEPLHWSSAGRRAALYVLRKERLESSASNGDSVRYYLLLDDRKSDWRSISRLVEEGVGHPILLKDLAQLEQSGVVQWIIPELSIVAHQLIADINSMLRAKSKDNTQFS